MRDATASAARLFSCLNAAAMVALVAARASGRVNCDWWVTLCPLIVELVLINVTFFTVVISQVVRSVNEERL